MLFLNQDRLAIDSMAHLVCNINTLQIYLSRHIAQMQLLRILSAINHHLLLLWGGTTKTRKTKARTKMSGQKGEMTKTLTKRADNCAQKWIYSNYLTLANDYHNDDDDNNNNNNNKKNNIIIIIINNNPTIIIIIIILIIITIILIIIIIIIIIIKIIIIIIQ